MLAVAIGCVATGVAWALLRLIGFLPIFSISADGERNWFLRPESFGLVGILVPVGGALIIGLMARYGSERIRGHGIPEAIESILINGSRWSRSWPS